MDTADRTPGRPGRALTNRRADAGRPSVASVSAGSGLGIEAPTGLPNHAGCMSVKLNKQAVKHARQLIKAGKVVRDERDAWSEDALAAKDETAWLKQHGWDEY